MSAMDEADLIDGCRRGEREAQRELYERFGEKIYRLTLRLSGNAQDAFDLTQDTFIRAFDRIAAFEGRAGISTWLYRVATNEALQLFRKRAAETRKLKAIAEHKAAETNDSASTNETGDLEEALASISVAHRTILILKYQAEMSYDEIAATLEISPGTVASRMNRARERLRAALQGDLAPVAEETTLRSHPNSTPKR